jgi:hypothetical protein
MNKKLRPVYFISSAAALSIGFLSYYFFRDSSLIFFQIFDFQITHGNIQLPDNYFTYFLKYNLSDGLWVLSGILFLRFIWFNNPGIGKYYIIVFIGIALLLELLQLIERFPGTFDIFDLLTMTFFALLEQCINYFFANRRNG